MNANKRVFGYVNCAYYNRRAEGDTTWFASAQERDSALERLRAKATSDGLGKTASRAGIYPVADRASVLSVEAREEIESLGSWSDRP